MRRIFNGIINLLLLVLIFVYFACITPINVTNATSLLGAYAYTGIPIIGFIFLLPAFIFTIIYMCTKSATIEFCRNMFGTLCAIFVFITGILGFESFTAANSLYIPLLVVICGAFELILSAIPLCITLFKKQEK